MTQSPTMTLVAGDSELLACRLNPAEQAEIGRAYASLALDYLQGIDRKPRRLVVKVSRTPDSQRDVARIVAVERECCPFMTVTQRNRGSRVTVTYSGEALVVPVLDAIEAALEAGRTGIGSIRTHD